MSFLNSNINNSGFSSDPKKLIRGGGIIFIAAILAYCLWVFILPIYFSNDSNANKGLAILFFIGVLWLSEAIHITVTALLVPVIAALVGLPGLNTTSALASFSNPIIFVFVGGFAIAAALNVQKLDRKIALWIMFASGGHLGRAAIMLFVATALLSMWISNTATAAMMIPLSLGLVASAKGVNSKNTQVFILLGVAYSAGIGGIGLLVGSPPNAIAAAVLDFSFMDWLWVSLPLLLVLLPSLIFVMYLVLKPDLSQSIDLSDEEIPWTLPRILTILVFVCVALAWVFGFQLSKFFGFSSPDTVIGLLGVFAVATLGLASWRQISERTEWGVLLLIGGGICLSNVMRVSGASRVLGEQMAFHLGGLPVFVIVLATAAFMIFLTEFTSNTGSTALMVPIFGAVAVELGLPAQLLVMCIAIGASCAFMMPVSAPPNGIAFATGYMAQRDMMRVGFVLNLVAIVIVSIWAFFVFY